MVLAARAPGLASTTRVSKKSLATPSARYRVKLVGAATSVVNVAVTVNGAETVTVQVPTPLQPPPAQPVKRLPLPAVAASVTVVPGAIDVTQVLPQDTPPGELTTVPLPLPVRATVSATGEAPPPPSTCCTQYVSNCRSACGALAGSGRPAWSVVLAP